jgi:hypothetical protein
MFEKDSLLTYMMSLSNSIFNSFFIIYILINNEKQQQKEEVESLFD